MPSTARDRTASIWTLSRLLYRLAEIPGIARLRYTTSHPRDMDDALIMTHGDLPALMPSLHLPVQSGSDRILEAMNRKHHGGRLPPHHRAHPRAPAGPRPVVGLHRRLSGRDRCGFRRHHAAGVGNRLCVLVLVQIQPAPRHARLRAGRSGARAGQGRAAGAAAKAVGNAKGGLQSPDSRAES